MASLDRALLRWAVGAAAPGADVIEVRGLRDGGSPWLLRLDRHGRLRGVVLRVGSAQDPSPLRTEVAALELAAMHDISAPRLVAAELAGDPPVVLTELLAGSSAIPVSRPTARLRALGGAAAALHTITVEPGPALPRRNRPIATVDFAALRREQPTRPLLAEAEERVANWPVAGDDVLVHGDLWQGNALWTGNALSGLVDWDCAGVGPAGVDLGSLRCDAAVCFDIEAADGVQRGWEEVTGCPAPDVAYWDVVAALSTPPDMGWFRQAIAGQGRPDLTQDVLLERRDAFLRSALSLRFNAAAAD
jgi:aminoglycoside phosphotransferase (APT) family kinase protein